MSLGEEVTEKAPAEAARQKGPLISSPQNERVKEYVALRKDGELRRKLGRFFLEGRRATAEALAAPRVRVLEVLYSDHLLGEDLHPVPQAAAQGIKTVRLGGHAFRKAADVRKPQGVAAVAALPEWSEDDLFVGVAPLIVVACGLQDPGNLGMLIRSCRAAGGAGLVVLEGTVDPFNAKVVRAAASGLLHLPVLRTTTAEFLRTAAERNVHLIAAETHGEITHRCFDWTRRPAALCIGSEGNGLPEIIRRACREAVRIEMTPGTESLNAAAAATVLLFEAREQLREAGGERRKG